MNNEQTFTTETIGRLVSERKAAMKKRTDSLANKIIEYVKSVYAARIQEALDDNVDCSSVRIHLPKAYRKALNKLTSDEYYMVRKTVSDSLSKNGFETTLDKNSSSCDGCPWKYFACTQYFVVEMKWNRYRYSNLYSL